MNWLDRVENDLSELTNFLDYFENELSDIKLDVSINGNLEKNIMRLPALVEKYYGNLQTIESVLEHLNIKLRKLRSQTFKNFLERYNKVLSSRDAEKYVDGNDDVNDMESLINRVAYLRNKFLSAVKALEIKQWQLSNVVRLRTSQMQDIEL